MKVSRLAAILLSSLIGLNSMASAQDYYFVPEGAVQLVLESNYKKGRPLKEFAELILNTDNSFRLSAKKDRSSGIKDLIENIVEKEDNEEFFAYLPDKEEWYELGINETIGEVKIDGYLRKLMKENERIEVYHTHLRSYLEMMKEKGYSDIPPIWLAFPSSNDVAQMIYFSEIFYRLHPDGEFSWNHCHPDGSTGYELTEEGKKFFSKGCIFLRYPTRLYSKENIMNMPEELFERDISNMPKKRFKVTGCYIRNLMKWLNELGEGHLLFEYTPYKKIIN